MKTGLSKIFFLITIISIVVLCAVACGIPKKNPNKNSESTRQSQSVRESQSVSERESKSDSTKESQSESIEREPTCEELGKHTYLGRTEDENGIFYITPEEITENNVLLLNGGKLTCDLNKYVEAVMNCERCSAEYMTVRVAMHHTVDDNSKTEIIEPTCTEDGSFKYTCAVCGATELDGVSEKLGHTFDREPTLSEPDSNGNRIYTAKCKCGEVYTENEIKNVTINHATCEVPEEYVFTLKDGTQKRITKGEKLDGHVIAYDEDGNPIAVNHRTIDSSDNEAILAAALDLEEYEQYITMILNGGKLEDATCKNAIYCLFTCQTCGLDNISVYIKGGHVPEKKADGAPDITVKEPTCLEGGHTSYTCGLCGTYCEYDYTEALGHDYKYTVVKEGDKVVKVEGVCKNNCGISDDRDCVSATVNKENEQLPTCTTPGYKIWNCVFVGGLEMSVEEEVPTVKTNHVLYINGEKVIVTSPFKITEDNKSQFTILNGEDPSREDKDVYATFTCAECGVHPTVCVTADASLSEYAGAKSTGTDAIIVEYVVTDYLCEDKRDEQ